SKEGLRRAIDVVMHNKSKITDKLVDYKWNVMELPGWREANAAREVYRASIDADLNQWQVFNLMNRLPNLQVPSALIWGVEDRFAVVELGRRLRDVLPDTEYDEVADGSHHCFVDVPEVINPMLIDFFDRAVKA